MKPMKLLIVYDSQYGASRRYAQWIAGQTGGRLLDRRQVLPLHLKECDVLIYGAGLYAGRLTGARWLAARQPLLEGKPLLLFVCGMLDPQSPGAEQRVRGQLAQTLPESLLGRARVFPLWGAMDYSRMSFRHRAMMAGLRLFLLCKGKNRSPQDQAILRSYGKRLDLVDETTAAPILAAMPRRADFSSRVGR